MIAIYPIGDCVGCGPETIGRESRDGLRHLKFVPFPLWKTEGHFRSTEEERERERVYRTGGGVSISIGIVNGDGRIRRSAVRILRGIWRDIQFVGAVGRFGMILDFLH